MADFLFLILYTVSTETFSNRKVSSSAWDFPQASKQSSNEPDTVFPLRSYKNPAFSVVPLKGEETTANWCVVDNDDDDDDDDDNDDHGEGEEKTFFRNGFLSTVALQPLLGALKWAKKERIWHFVGLAGRV